MDNQILKTTNINYSGGATQISGNLETSVLAANTSIYSAGDITIANTNKLVASKIVPASGSLEIGSLTTPVYINGFLYNPIDFTSFKFSQW
jgi:hypothetical protein